MTLAIGPVEEVARERCECGDYQYTPRTWKAIKDVGIRAHLPHRLGGCQVPEAELSETVQQGAAVMDEKVQQAAAPAPKQEAPKEETAVPQETKMAAAEEAVEQPATTGAPSKETVVLRGHPVRFVDGLAEVSKAAKALKVSKSWLIRVIGYNRVARRKGARGRLVVCATREDIEAGERALRTAEEGGGRSAGQLHKKRGRMRMSHHRDTMPAGVAPVRDGFVTLNRLIHEAIGRSPAPWDMGRVTKALGLQQIPRRKMTGGPSPVEAYVLPERLAHKMNDKVGPELWPDRWKKVRIVPEAEVIMDLDPLRSRHAARKPPPPRPFDHPAAKAREAAREAAGRAQRPPPSVEVEELQRIILKRPAALKEALEAAGVTRLLYADGKLSISVEMTA